MSTVSTIQNLLELVADGNKQLVDKFGVPFRLSNNTPEDIANTAIGAATGSRLDKRNSNTFFRSLGEFQDKTGIVLADTPKSIKITSPVIPALRGNSSVNALFPQNKLIYEYNNQFDPNTIVTPALLHDGKQSLLFAPTGKVDENSLRPLKRLTDQEHVGRVLDNVSRIMADPTIPERAKSVLASTIGSDVYGGFSSNKDGSLNINYDKLTGFLAALTDDQPFRQSLGEEGSNLWDLRRQFSTLDKLDKTVNNPYYRSYRGENGSAPVLLGYTFGVDPDGSVRSMHNIAQKKGDTPKPVYFSGIKANLDQKSIKKQSDIRDKINEGYKEVPVDNNLYLDSERVSNQGAYDSNTKSIIGQGNLLFTNQQLPRSEALRLQKEYVRSLENAVNSHLYQSMGKVEKPILAGEKANGGVKISGDTAKSVRNTGLSQLTNDAEVGTIGYITKPIAGKDGTVRNAKRLAVKMNGGIQEGRVAIKGKDVVFSAGTSGNTVTIPLGQINVKTNQLGEEVVELPSILNKITGGRVKYNPEEINTLEVTPSFREGEDKLQALARIATMDIPSGGEVVQFPVPFKRFSEDTDNFLKTSLGSDNQSQLLARALNFADPNRAFAKQLGVDVIPDSRWNEALKIKPVEGITSTAILPISRDVQQSTGKDWAELYAQQMVGADGSVLPSIVVPYNPSQGNDLLKESVEQAYQNLTGNKAEIQFTEDIDGVPIGYLGQKPSQVRYFPTTETWQERGRKPVTNPKSLKRSIAGWLGGNDQYIKEAEIVAPQNTLISPEDLASQIARSDKTMGGYARTDSPRIIYKNPGEYYGTGLGAYDTRSGDLWNVGSPRSTVEARYSEALATIFDPRTQSLLSDVPEFTKDPTFLAAYRNDDKIILSPEQVDQLERWVQDDSLGFSAGQAMTASPMTIIRDEAMSSEPAFIVKQKYGTPGDDYKGTIVDNSGLTSVVPMGRNQVQFGIPDEDVVHVKTTKFDPTLGRIVQEQSFLPGEFGIAERQFNSVRNKIPYPVSYGADGKIVRIYSPTLRPVQGSAAVRTGERLVNSRQAIINQALDPTELANERIIEAGMTMPVLQKYQELESIALAKGNTESAKFYRSEADILKYQANRKPILKQDKRLEGLNLDEQSINLLNDYLPSEQRIQMSDISSTNDPWQANYEQSTGWSDGGTIEPSVMPVEIMPDNKIYSERYGVGADPQYIIQGENGTKYIYIPDDVQRKLQDDYDLAALRERQMIANNLRFVQNESFNPQLPNILDEVDRTSVRPNVTEQPTLAWQQIVTEQIAPYTPEGRRRAMEAQAIAAATNNTTQSVGVRPKVLEVNNSSRNTSSATPISAAVRTNQLTPEQQQYLMLGLGGAGVYGLYNAMNQQDNRRVA